MLTSAPARNERAAADRHQPEVATQAEIEAALTALKRFMSRVS